MAARSTLLFILAMLTTPHIQAADPASDMYLKQVDLVEQNVLTLAQAMPAGLYDYVPKEGAFSSSRTFGEQVRHTATMIYMTAAIVLGERSPYGPGKNDNGPDSVHSKDECVKYLQDSLAYARKAMSSLTTENHLQPVKTFFGPMPRAAVAAGIAFHSYDHYGQMVVYARLNNVIPPASVPGNQPPLR